MKTNANKVSETTQSQTEHGASYKECKRNSGGKWGESGESGLRRAKGGKANDNKGIFQYCSALRIRAVGQNK